MAHTVAEAEAVLAKTQKYHDETKLEFDNFMAKMLEMGNEERSSEQYQLMDDMEVPGFS